MSFLQVLVVLFMAGFGGVWLRVTHQDEELNQPVYKIILLTSAR